MSSPAGFTLKSWSSYYLIEQRRLSWSHADSATSQCCERVTRSRLYPSRIVRKFLHQLPSSHYSREILSIFTFNWDGTCRQKWQTTISLEDARIVLIYTMSVSEMSDCNCEKTLEPMQMHPKQPGANVPSNFISSFCYFFRVKFLWQIFCDSRMTIETRNVF